MDIQILCGMVIASVMLFSYALKRRGRFHLFVFALIWLLASLYLFWLGAPLVAALQAVLSAIAFHRWLKHTAR